MIQKNQVIKNNFNTTVLLLIFIISVIYTYFAVPNFLKYDGGNSCIQGISALFSVLMLAISSFINTIAFIFLYYLKEKPVKILGTIALLIWIISILLLDVNHIIASIIYFIPYLVINLCLIIYANKPNIVLKEENYKSI